jgi:iron(III) transport system permease protein
MRFILGAAALAAATLSCGNAWAQGWPAKTVRIVVPFAPGGTADTLGRLVALPLIDIPLTGMWFILPLVLAVRRLPYTVRGSYSSLLLVHKSMEEAAENVGATKLRTFRDITVPLVWKGIFVGGLFSFITSIQEASSTIFLTTGGNEMIPFGIFSFYIAGSQSQAAALGVILIAVCAVSLFIVNRVAGARVGGLFG